MAKVKTKADFVKRWQDGFGRAGQSWITGSQQTMKDPTQLASAPAALAKAAGNYADAAREGGRMQQGLQRSGKAGWLAGIVSAGASALTAGAKKGATKLNGAIGDQLIAAQNAASAAAESAGDSSRARWEASVNAMKAAFGKPPVS